MRSSLFTSTTARCEISQRTSRDRPEIASRAARLLPRGARSARDRICAVAVTPSTWQINDRPFLIEQRGQSNLLAAALRDLEDSPAVHVAHGSPAATFYVGHDTNLDGLGVLLNLSWAPEPYPRDATPPGAILRLSAAGDEIRADYMCAPLTSVSPRTYLDLLQAYRGLTGTRASTALTVRWRACRPSSDVPTGRAARRWREINSSIGRGA